MKKTISIFLAIVVSVCAMAQTKQHMKFMGIPMGISITNFQNKLVAKGVKYDNGSKNLSSGTRMFNGTFAGHDASIFIYYDITSKNVYRAKAVLERNDLSMIYQLFDEYYSMLEEKYYDELISPKVKDDDGFNTCTVFTKLGRIDMFIKQMDADYYFHIHNYYVLHIDYYDRVAQSETKSNRLDDL